MLRHCISKGSDHVLPCSVTFWREIFFRRINAFILWYGKYIDFFRANPVTFGMVSYFIYPHYACEPGAILNEKINRLKIKSRKSQFILGSETGSYAERIEFLVGCFFSQDYFEKNSTPSESEKIVRKLFCFVCLYCLCFCFK